MTTLYGGIDLHANNSMIVLLDEQDHIVFRKRFPNQLEKILQALAPYAPQLHGVVVESTSNWYWLVDGLMNAGYPVHLANTERINSSLTLTLIPYTDAAPLFSANRSLIRWDRPLMITLFSWTSESYTDARPIHDDQCTR